MTKFICLTEVCTSTETKQLILNIDRIVHFQMGAKGRDVHIRMDDKTYYFVKESIEDIKKMVGAPIVANAATLSQADLDEFKFKNTYTGRQMINAL